jgi:hypothetical protein
LLLVYLFVVVSHCIGVTDASAFLNEKIGDLANAIELYIAQVASQIEVIEAEINDADIEVSTIVWLSFYPFSLDLFVWIGLFMSRSH